MTKIRSALRLAASSVLAAALLAPALAAADSQARPFKVQLATYEELWVDTTICPVYTGRTTGRGVATHVGAVALTASDCVMPQVEVGPQGPRLVGFAFGPGNNVGTFTLVAANGERVTGSYRGILVPVSATLPLFAVQGTYDISGGTGRFAGAAGKGDLQGQLLLNQNPTQMTASGTIEMVGTIIY